ncbi:putative uncharacterized protein DDB_G0271606 isoform X2 [Drosophila busckii]|uniref:putative uncharacterized protein DDB_G0271606 isoform X2 n=1 Tax=Drosophila busckii TaxID=30019 RepID=UPI00083EC773|nr:putative uncharacterized protein DDB_G0271606 isoform X2 [Drosophila busckii]
MDFHILIVIGCVFSASLLSFLFINKIFRRKTFEEVVAEKRALSANLYNQNKSGSNAAAQRKPKKKDLKREKKQRQREQQKDQEDQEDYSDNQSEEQGSVGQDDEPVGLSKQHVEFDPDPEILNEQQKENQPSNNNNNNNHNNNAKKSKKDKRNGAASKPAAGILVNKNEPVAVKAVAPLEEVPVLNNFDVRPPKDVVELKKQEQKEQRKEDTKQQLQKKNAAAAKKDKPNAAPALLNAALEQLVEVPHVPKQQQQVLKQQPSGSPKLQQSNKQNKQQQTGKKQKDTALSGKDLVQALDKLAEHQTVGVSALMNVFSRAELNRSEIQILIDYLLNKQQDMPASHGDWSDDICQKLKRQLEEKEKLLSEEQEASIGIQAKLRELRHEINQERAQLQSRSQAYNEQLLAKEQELAALNQELASVNEKFALERQQFQAKLVREKQASSQDLLPQLQRLQQDLAHKEKVIADMSSFVQAEAQQKNELLQQREELETRLNSTIFELEQRKELETENSELKVELRNLHNALESSKTELSQSQVELKRICSTELQDLRQQKALLEASHVSLNQQLSQANSQVVQQSAQQSEQAQAQSEAMQALQSEVRSLNDAQSKQQQQTTALQSQLEEAQKRASQLQEKEQQLQLELQEQREKNNQQQKQLQQQKAAAANGGEAVAIATSSSAKAEQQRIRELYQRLYPQAVKVHAATALNASFDEWLEQVLATYVKQQMPVIPRGSHKSTQSSETANSSSSSSSDHNNTHNNISSNNSNSNSKSSSAEQEELHTQNLKLRKRNDELTQLVTKTSNTLVDLEQRAREQDEHWRGIVSQKEQLISKLQQHASNGEQDI